VTNAISPAKVQRVSIVDDAERVMEVIVEDKQLSLAIGKKGQNVRLAAKLTGWKIDIKSEEEKRREVEAQLGALEIGGTEEAQAEDGAQPEEGMQAEAGGEDEDAAEASAPDMAPAVAEADAGEGLEATAVSGDEAVAGDEAPAEKQ
jgi:hypothetical protein